MSDTANAARDDLATIAAIAVVASCIVAVDHEAIGHGSACLALGGHVTRLTSVYFHCSAASAWIDPAGPAGNLTGAVLAWLAGRWLPARMVRLRLMLLLITAFALFWEGGYLFKSMLTLDGDSANAARAAFGEPAWPWRIGGVLLGIVLYAAGIAATISSMRALAADRARTRHILRVSWLAATAAACGAALAYAPDRLEAMHQAALEIGAASWPLLFLAAWAPPAMHGGEHTIGKSFCWIAFAAIVFAVFALTLGQGLY